MVAVVSGAGLGLERSSAWVLGSRGQLGQAGLGRAGENVYVNAATGNLVISNQDEFLVGLGQDSAIARTYNSLGKFTDDNGDNWRPGVARRVLGLTGTVNTAGSTITRVDWDGSESVFEYDAGRKMYVFKEGAGAHDTLSFASGVWTWRDGNSRVKEVYDGEGRISTSSDTDGHELRYAYGANGLISRVTTADGGYTTFGYDSNKRLTELYTVYKDADGTTLKSRSRIYYTYDSLGRLETVKVDLSPGGNSTADNNVYLTTYTYEGTSNRVLTITQTDGSKLEIDYTLVGGEHRVEFVIQTSATGVERRTRFTYDTANRTTSITDAAGKVTKLTYDAANRLIGTESPPAVSGGAVQKVDYEYDSDGNLTSVRSGTGSIVYTYDSNGNVLTERDALGNTVTRTYGLNNELLTETRHLVPSGTAQATDATARFVYDAENHLVFVVSAEGNVTRFVYNDAGQRIAHIEYVDQKYTVSGLAPDAALSEAQMKTWLGDYSDFRTSKRTDTAYDFRGNVSTVTSYREVWTSGVGDPSTAITTTYVYDQSGNLLSKLMPGASREESYIYDGLGRMIGSTDANGHKTSIKFEDAAGRTIVDFANGLQKISVYNLAGELISQTQSAADVAASATTVYRYDALGKLRISIDPTGWRTNHVYDAIGNKVADIGADGSITEYRYDSNNLLVATIVWKNRLSATQLASLSDSAGNPKFVDIGTLRPAPSEDDRWEWRIYDKANRLVQTIDAVGAITAFRYDGASRLVSTTTFFNRVPADTLSTFKTTLPVGPVTANDKATHDRTSRSFYDKDDRLVGVLDAEGYLTQIVYDGAGQKIETIRYASATSETYRSGGTFAQLLGSVTASVNPKNIHNYFLYDVRGLLRASIDGEGGLTRYSYDALGHLSGEVRGQKLDPAALRSVRPTLWNLPASTSDVLDAKSYERDPYGRLLAETRTLSGGATERDVYEYDSMGQLIRKTSNSNRDDKRILTQRYDGFGRLIAELGGEGSKALADLGTGASADQIASVYRTYGTSYVYDAAGRLVAKHEPRGDGGPANRTLYYYDAEGKLLYTINPLGEVTENRYNEFDQLSETISYAKRIAAASLQNLSGGTNVAAVTSALRTDSLKDGHRALEYDAKGRIKRTIDWLSSTSSAAISYHYNSFGELERRIDPIEGTDTVETSMTYDRRGLLSSTTRDSASGGLGLQTRYIYDAFGRRVETIDAKGIGRNTAYDRAGRVVETYDAFDRKTSFTYDGRGNVLSITDRTGKATTRFAYTAFNRQITVTTPEQVVSVTTKNAFGEVLSSRDGAGRRIINTYDRDGNLTSTTKDLDDDGIVETTDLTVFNSYDKAGRLEETTDERGFKTRFEYDSADRLKKRIVDPAGLNLITQYDYDGRGQQIKVTNENGVVTVIDYSKNGRKTTVTVDPDRLNLVTSYTYDLRGRALTVTEATGPDSQRVTRYIYDKADRLRETQMDPDGLNLRTSYSYDGNGNVVLKVEHNVSIGGRDANNRVTRFAYDNENRLIFAVDGAGGVTETRYDEEGRVAMKRAYTQALGWEALAALSAGASPEQVAAKVTASANDQFTHHVYDADGRLRFTVGATRRVVEHVYDGSGNVIRTRQFTESFSPGRAINYAELVNWVQYNSHEDTDRVTHFVYNAANRLTFTVDANDGVTLNRYDKAGNLTKQIVFTKRFTRPLAELESWVGNNYLPEVDRVTRTVYDAANRVAFTIDASGLVTEYTRDMSRNVLKRRENAQRYTAAGDPSLSDMTAWAAREGSSDDRITRTFYNAAGWAGLVVDPEGYVTEYHYELTGQVKKQIRYASPHAASDSDTLLTLKDRIGYTPPEDAAVTSFLYDDAGRLTDTIDAENSRTHLLLDALGQVLETTRAFGTGEASTIARTYDGAGRVKTETRGAGTADASTSSYVYDGVGQVKRFTDGRTYSTDTEYDALGNVRSVTKPVEAGKSATTTYEYSDFGVSKMIDARGNATRYYYDSLGRLTLTVDAENYVTQTGYSIGGQVTKITRFYNKATFDPQGALVMPAVHAKDATTLMGRDRMDRLTSVTDAENHKESYELNVFGDRWKVTNKLGGETVNVYDRRGLLRQETLPIASFNNAGTQVAATVTNKFEYDFQGNRKSMVEAHGLAEQRSTWFKYDKMGRLISKTGDAVAVYASDLETITGWESPVETRQYDKRGNLIEVKNPAGERTLFYYNALDQKIAEINAYARRRTWTYDKNGNVLTELAHNHNVQMPATAGGTPPFPFGAPDRDRLTTYVYDRSNRLIETRSPSLWVWESGKTPELQSVVSKNFYDAAGNVVRQEDGRGNAVLFFYDKLGRVKARIDQERYLTYYHRDAEGNVLLEERFITQLQGTPSEASNVDALRDSVIWTGGDRRTSYTYDRNGRRLSESRANVAARTVNDSTGYLSDEDSAATSTISYSYNAMGQLDVKTEANLDSVDYDYDLGGRLIKATNSAFTNHSSVALSTTTMSRVTQTYYNGLGDVVRTRVGNGTTASASDRITTYSYADRQGGRLEAVTDAEQFTRNFRYDKAGRVLRETWDRVTANSGGTVREGWAFGYNALGLVTSKTAIRWNGSAWVHGIRHDTAYNSFGEVSAKGINGGAQEKFDYDNGGRLWRTTAGDGTIKLFLHDAAGNATATIASAGTNISTWDLGTAIDTLTRYRQQALGTVDVPGVAVTIGVYDKRGQVIETREPFRELAFDSAGNRVLETIVGQRQYNAFGELKREIDARGHVTDYSYNTLGRMTVRQRPTTNVTSETGSVTRVRPTEYYYYDIAGRLIGTDDANGNRNTRRLLAHTGHGGSEALVVAEFHADRVGEEGVVRTGYDVFGDARKIKNELGFIESRSYDMMSRLKTIVGPARAANTPGNRTGAAVSLTRNYEYDGLGQRIRHWNSQFGSGVVEETDYDELGRVTRQKDFEGHATTYSYSYNGNLETTGVGTRGGWTKTTVQAGKSASESQDYFGRMLTRTDFGGHRFDFTYNVAGQLTREAGATTGTTSGRDLRYTYFNTGKVSTIQDLNSVVIDGQKLNFESSFRYDKAGNRTFEQQISRRYIPGNTPVTTVHQRSTAYYDELNRVERVEDDSGTAGTPLTVTWEYDANGNVRHKRAAFRDAVNSSTQRNQDFWYRYDNMNRVLTGQGGYELKYNAAGQRVSATQAILVRVLSGPPTLLEPGDGTGNGETTRIEDKPGERVEYFTYTEDGYLSTVRIAESVWDPAAEDMIKPTLENSALRVVNDRDALGRVTAYKEYSKDGPIAFSRDVTYNKINQVLTESTSTRKKEGNGNTYVLVTSSTYDYVLQLLNGQYAGAYAGGVVTRIRTDSHRLINGTRDNEGSASIENRYTWWDGAEQSSVRIRNFDDDGNTTHDGTSTYTYDSQGRVAKAAIRDGRSRNLHYITNSAGQILSRTERSTELNWLDVWSGSQNDAAPYDYFFYFNGRRIGEVGNDGGTTMDYNTTIARRQYIESTSDDPAFRYGEPKPHADFDQNYDPINATSQGSTDSRYQVRDGDTLQSIAAAVWGDASMWYLLASANGLSGSETLTEGTSLIVPAKVTNIHNNADTFRPYDRGYALGDTSPGTPKEQKQCGIAGEIMLTIVSVAISKLLTPVVGPMAANGIANFATQGIRVITGYQDSIDLRQVGIAAASAGISDALPNIPGASRAVNTMVNAGITNASSQGMSIAVGLQDKFNFTNMAVSVVSAGVSAEVGRMQGLGLNPYYQPTVQEQLISNLASASAGAATRAVLDRRTSFGENLLAEMPGVIGETAGNSLAMRLRDPLAELGLNREEFVAGFEESGMSREEAIEATASFYDGITKNKFNPFDAGGLSGAAPRDFWPTSPDEISAYEKAREQGDGWSGANAVAFMVRRKNQFERLLAHAEKTNGDLHARLSIVQPHFNMSLLSADVYYGRSISELLPTGFSVLNARELGDINLHPDDLQSDSGYFARVYKDAKGHIYYANRGTDMTSGIDWRNNFLQRRGRLAPQYEEAILNAKEVRRALRADQVTFTGHSLGGGLAIAQGLVTDTKATTFNASGVHWRTLLRHGKDFRHAEVLITAFNIDGELLSTVQDRGAPEPGGRRGDFIPAARGRRIVLPPVEADGRPFHRRLDGLSIVYQAAKLHGIDRIVQSMYNEVVEQVPSWSDR